MSLEREAASAALFDGERDPDLEERVNESFLVFAEVDRAESDACDDSFDGGAISLRGGEEHVGGPVREDRVGHVLAAEGIERTRVSDAGRKRGPAVGDGLSHLVGRVDHEFAGERVAVLRGQAGDRRAGQRQDDDFGVVLARQRPSDGRGRAVGHGFVAGMARTERDLMSGGGSARPRMPPMKPVPITAISTA